MARHLVSCKKMNEAFDGAASAKCTCGADNKQPDQCHPFTGRGRRCAYNWPGGEEPSEPCGLPRDRHQS